MLPPKVKGLIIGSGRLLITRRGDETSRRRPKSGFCNPDRESALESWTLDVLNVVRGLDKKEFALLEVYALAPRLQALHPGNRHVRDKIRQQLQVRRDLGLDFVHLCCGKRRKNENVGRQEKMVATVNDVFDRGLF